MVKTSSLWVGVGVLSGMLAGMSVPAMAAGKVAVFKNPVALASQGPSRSDMIAAVLNGAEGLKAELVGALDAATLKPFDALILPNEAGSAVALKEQQVFLRQWVTEGHGLMANHDAVGYKNHVALFPEIAVGSGNFFTTQQPYQNEFCLVAEEPDLTTGMTLKRPCKTSYYDLVTVTPGEQGRVLARLVATSGKNLFSGAPAVVAGKVGKGRFVACGLLLGGLAPNGTPVAPRDGERQLLLDMARFIVGQGDLDKLSEELGPNVYLGAVPDKACPWEKNLPGLSVAKILADCQIASGPVTWQDSASSAPLKLNDLEPGTPVIEQKFLEFYTTVPPYDPVPKSWERLPIEAWKMIEIPGATNNPVDDAGTANGYWKVEADEQGWTNSPASKVAVVRWQRGHVILPPVASGKRVVLCFEGVKDSASVYVNGKKVGSHQGAGIPFEFDITATAKAGVDNVVAVRSFNGIYERVSVQIRPDIYAERLLINPKPESNGVEVVVTLLNNSEKTREMELEAEIAPYQQMAPWIEGKRQTTHASLGKVVIAPGKSEHVFLIKMEQPVCWSPENPFLYVLNLRSAKMDLAQERFGYRTFLQKGRFLFLNGKRIFLRGAVTCYDNLFGGSRQQFIENKGRLTQRVLLAYKALNFNNLNPQAIGASLPREFFDQCDEIGLLLYDLNPYYSIPYDMSKESAMLMARYGGNNDASDNLKVNPVYLSNIERYFLRNYNHPSYVMFAISTEWSYKIYSKPFRAVCDLLKRLDGQNRPVCPCSGDNPAWTSFTFSQIADIHVYPGDINGHPWDHKQLIFDFNEKVWEYFEHNLPVVNYEAGGAMHTIASGIFKSIQALWTNAIPDKVAIVKDIEGADAAYTMPLNARWLTMYGIRRYVIDDYNRAMKEKRPVESYRQEYMLRNQIGSSRLAGDLFQGFGINFQRFYYAFAAKPGTNLQNDWPYTFKFSDLRHFWAVGPTFIDNPIVAASGFNPMRRYCNPKLVMLDLLQSKNSFAGKSFKTTLYAINDTGDDSEAQQLRVVISDKDNRRLFDQTAKIGVVPAAKRKLVPFEWAIPADLPTSTLRVELFLLEGGKVVSDNSFEFHVLGRNEFADRIPANGKRVALYDSAADNGCPERSVSTVLDQLGIKYERLRDFSSLAKFNVLIIGAASVDNQVFKGNVAIAAWLEKGGRLLQLEQEQPGAVAGIPNLNIVRKMGGSVADMVVPTHPVFAGLQVNDYWNLWNGDLPEAQGYGREGGIYTCLIGPLNETVVATGLLDVPRANPKSVQMMIADAKVGQGMILVSQAEAVMRYGKDSVATKYLQNVLCYILSDEMNFSTSLSGFTINTLDFFNFGFVDMQSLANQGRVFPQDWLDGVEGGLKTLGQLRFRLEKGKVLRLGAGTGSVTVKFPGGMPLMFPEREKQKVVKDVDQGTLSRTMFDTLYVLHTVAKAGLGQVVGEYTLRYKDGTTATFPLVLGKNIGLDGKQDSLEDGKYLGSGLYVTRLVNPAQDKEVATLELKVAAGCELDVAGVTATLARKKIHD